MIVSYDLATIAVASTPATTASATNMVPLPMPPGGPVEAASSVAGVGVYRPSGQNQLSSIHRQYGVESRIIRR